MKIRWVVVSITILLVLGFLFDKACFQLPQALKDAEAKYQVLVAETALKDEAAAAERARLMTELAVHEEHEASLEAAVETTTAQLRAAKATIADLQAQEPETTPEIEALPIVINLRAQVAQFSLALEAAESTIASQREEISLLKQDKMLLVAQADTWRAQYEREHALHLAAKGLYDKSTKVLGLFKLSGIAKDILIGGLAATAIYGLVK